MRKQSWDKSRKSTCEEQETKSELSTLPAKNVTVNFLLSSSSFLIPEWQISTVCFIHREQDEREKFSFPGWMRQPGAIFREQRDAVCLFLSRNPNKRDRVTAQMLTQEAHHKRQHHKHPLSEKANRQREPEALLVQEKVKLLILSPSCGHIQSFLGFRDEGRHSKRQRSTV